MIWIILSLAYLLMVGFMIKFFQRVKEWDEEIHEMTMEDK
jgi:hypothetical protein